GLTLSDNVPDAKTIWLFREQLTKASAIEKLFGLFNKYLNNEGLIAHEGKMVDASFVEVPIQRNTRQENKDIKEGNVPERWDENPHKVSQKDTDARWTKKNGRSYYGYKNHVKADKKSKLIDTYIVTDASVHDSQETENLLSDSDTGQSLHADSAYSGESVSLVVEHKKMINQIHEKGYRNKPLT
ncbi:MAG: IS5 family transposase, partial [Bacteroidota bacterium]|nr:IS5 family transposase [Bacteroidota bacterium]